MLNVLRNNHGDTIIEVLFAISVFSLISVGGLSIMNQGTMASQRALELTLVRNEVNAQSEVLRFLNSSYVASFQSGVNQSCTGFGASPSERWRYISCVVAQTSLPPSQAQFDTTGNTCPGIPSGSFIMNTKTASAVVASSGLIRNISTVPSATYSKLSYSGSSLTSADGIWIQAYKSTISGNNQSNAGYIDFYIRACWESYGQSKPQTIGTVVRLYEPR